MAGGDQVFGNHTDAESLKSVFDAAYNAGLTMWDTATVYGMGASEEEEISALEALAAETGVDTKGSWENHMA